MTKIYTIHLEGMGTGAKSGMNKATTKLKDKTDGSVVVCRFYNGHAIFIKDNGKIRPITDKEVAALSKEVCNPTHKVCGI